MRFSDSAKLIHAPSVQQSLGPIEMPSQKEASGDDHEHAATNRCFSKWSMKAKTKISVIYAYMALGDYRFIAANVERERPTTGEPVFLSGNGSATRTRRAV